MAKLTMRLSKSSTASAPKNKSRLTATSHASPLSVRGERDQSYRSPPLRAILVAGPTASGKSALALALAERLGAAIVNADALQVYRDLNILTARPSPRDEARAPHVLYGFAPGHAAYSAGLFIADAKREIGAARTLGRPLIFVGGTGLYFKALLEGLSPIPAIPDEVRSHWRGEADRLGARSLHGVLADRDPDTAARLDPGDSQRIVRALEVIDSTGRSLADWRKEPGRPVLAEAATIRLVVWPERDELHQRCDARFDAMMRAGALDEAAQLKAFGLDPALPIMRALGMRPLLRHLAGEIDLPCAAGLAKTETRQYVKRQATWLRKNMISWKWLSTKQMESLDQNLLSFVGL